jgi:hypothetical protein
LAKLALKRAEEATTAAKGRAPSDVLEDQVRSQEQIAGKLQLSDFQTARHGHSEFMSAPS